jgi:hypothetical protein
MPAFPACLSYFSFVFVVSVWPLQFGLKLQTRSSFMVLPGLYRGQADEIVAATQSNVLL